MSNSEIQLHYKIESKDFDDFNFSHNFSSSRIRTLLIVIVLFLAMVIYFAVTSPTPMMTALVVLYIALFIFVPLRVKMVSRKVYNSNPFFKEEQELIINSDGVKLHSTSNNLEFGWEKVYTVRETKLILAIYISTVQAVILPKRILTESQLNQLQELLKEKIDSNKLHTGRIK